jgi:hypothetical protein
MAGRQSGPSRWHTPPQPIGDTDAANFGDASTHPVERARQLRLIAVAEMKTTTATIPNAINMAHLKGKPHRTRLLQRTNGVVMKEFPFGSKYKQRGARFLSSRNKNAPVRRRPLDSNRKKIACDEILPGRLQRCAWSAMARTRSV